MLFNIVNAKDDSFEECTNCVKGAYENNGYISKNDGKKYEFPFTDRFQKYFRKDKEGNLHHFENVTAATARLIAYFQNYANVIDLFKQAPRPTKHEIEDLDALCEEIMYEERDMRTCFAAFYHDIGKTQVDHRHGMEGAMILSENTTRFQYEINAIAESYKSEFSIDRCDILPFRPFILP